MAFMAALEADLRALSAEARRRHPAVKDAAEHATLKLRSLSNPREIAQKGDILRIFLMACSVKSVKLSVIGLSCLQKLISHDAVASSALKEILATLRDHSEMPDESLQLKTLQTMLIVFQSHLRPESEEDMSQALGICLHLLESSRSSDSVRNTAAATFRQAVALVFDNVVLAESLPTGKASPRFGSSASSVANNVTRSFGQTLSLAFSYGELTMREDLTDVGKLGLRLLEDLTALAAGGSARWLHAQSLHWTFALDILEFVLSTYVPVFRALLSYQQVLRHQICSLLMTSLRTNVELEGEAGEPAFRRLVLRLVAHVIRLYSSSLVTEMDYGNWQSLLVEPLSEVFLNMLVKVTRLDLPLWHQILVLEILRGFCVEARTLRSLFQTFDINPTNTNVVENIVKALALVVATIQVGVAEQAPKLDILDHGGRAKGTLDILYPMIEAVNLPEYLIHLIAKLFAKALSLRLAPRLGGMVSTNRSAFIAGCSIQDNFLLMQQTARLIHNLKVPLMMLKLDIARAFDSVSWPFLLQILSHLGFDPCWREWISILLATASTRVALVSMLVNGVPGHPISHARGLRQGDPLSPMLLTLIIDVLNSLILRAVERGMLRRLTPRHMASSVSLYAENGNFDSTLVFVSLSKLVRHVLSQYLMSYPQPGPRYRDAVYLSHLSSP
ncbi:unnamed protein product [Triticum turgidum subsp. durum]|uniref:Protein MON2 homolog n=1 Tax=Triticum turgidum subsp. durum TaxID=4567 RepID=A0A9R0RQG1_TRITD|nr:unnamed protein product [Triticum turgidum subsp. durum]